MSAPLAPEIYRRRRIAAVVIIVVVIALLIWAISAITSNRGNDDNQDVEARATSETVSVSRTDGTEVTERSEEPRPLPGSTTVTEVDKDHCELGDLVLTARTNQPNYGSDDKPQLSLIMQNPTRGDCEIDLDEATLRFEVFDLATNRKVWSDLDCHDSEGQGTQVIEAGEEATFAVTWSRLSSSPGKCGESERTEVPAGNYVVYGLVGSRNSEPATFNLN